MCYSFFAVTVIVLNTIQCKKGLISVNLSEIKANFKPLYDEPRSILVCVDSYEDKLMSGRIVNMFLGDECRFNNLMQLLLIVEDMLSDSHYPQSFTGQRRFSKNRNEKKEPANPSGKPSSAAPTGEVATFSLRILFRQHATWQGSLFWMEKDQSEDFRSVLEIIYLMDDALSHK